MFPVFGVDYCAVVTPGYHRFTTEGGDSVSCPDQPPKTGSDGLCRPFGYHPDPKAAGAWVLIFFINGASVFTGRRIVVGDVATTNGYRPNATFMPLAYDLNDVRNRKTKDQENKPAGRTHGGPHRPARH